jgi:hypothetical protein
MKTVLQKSTFGIVLTLRDFSDANDTPPLSAHLILNRRLIDDDGRMCLTASTGFHGVLDMIDALKSELDSLANETVLWLAQNIVSRRARFSVISNDGSNAVGGEKAAEDTLPVALRRQTVLALHCVRADKTAPMNGK